MFYFLINEVTNACVYVFLNYLCLLLIALYFKEIPMVCLTDYEKIRLYLATSEDVVYLSKFVDDQHLLNSDNFDCRVASSRSTFRKGRQLF